MQIKYRDFEHMSEPVRKAFHIAKEYHKGQKDKAGKDYIYHPMAVASLVSEDEQCIITALLHDTAEDTDFTIEEARRLFGDEIGDALDHITHRKGEAYMDYVKRAAENSIAREVKTADLTHNMDLSRFEHPSERDLERLEKKYKPAMEYLNSRQ